MVAEAIFCTIGSVWRNPNGNRNVPYLNWNGNERNLNLNWFENDWNEYWRFATVRNLFCFPPYLAGLFYRFYPSAEHSADFVQFFRKANVFFIVQRFYFPGNLQKEF